jgi:hypothetical protein
MSHNRRGLSITGAVPEDPKHKAIAGAGKVALTRPGEGWKQGWKLGIHEYYLYRAQSLERKGSDRLDRD